MTSIRLPESVGLLTKTSSTVVSLAASRINIGGQQYVTVNPLTLSVGTIGAGGVDATLTGNSLYYVYAVVSAGAMALVGSKVSTLPAGFTSARLVGHFNTDGALNINRALSFMVLEREQASLATSDLRNLIINGNIDFWQRGTSLVIANNVATSWTADRIFVQNTIATNVTAARDTDVPTFAQSGFQSRYSLSLTNATASAVTNQFINIQYRMEGQDYQAIHGAKKIRIQLWVKTSQAGTYSVTLQNASQNRCLATPFTVSTADVTAGWVKKSVEILTDTAGTGWNFDNTIGVIIFINLMAGAAQLTSSQDTWQSVLVFGVSSQVNWAQSAGATFKITQVALYQVDANGLDLPFYRHGKDIQQELAACQRYYEVWKPSDSFAHLGIVGITATNSGILYYAYKASKRSRPTGAGYTGSFQFLGSSGTWTSFAFISDGQSTELAAISIAGTGFTNGTAGFMRAGNDLTASFYFDSEL